MINLFTHGVPHLTKRKLTRLLAGIQPIVGHARFAKGFHHLSKLFFTFV